MIERASAALEQLPSHRREQATLVFTAHSIPQVMADNCRYEAQLHEACRLVAEGLSNSLSLWERAGVRVHWHLAYQSRSGPPQQPWLEPDIGDFLRCMQQDATEMRDVIIIPIGFISDHLEVVYDLDTEARQLCEELGINMIRAATVGTHPRFISMIRELIVERMSPDPQRLALGSLGPNHDICPDDCCLYPRSASPSPSG
jgi:ferrochelatase